MHRADTIGQSKIHPKTEKLVDEHVGLDSDERIILLARKHWVVFRNSLFIGLFIPFVLLSILLLVYMADLGWPDNYMRWLLAGLLGLSAITFVFGMATFAWHYHMWNHTFYVMTNKKLAIINRYKPWSYEVQQMSLNNINDVTLRREGMEAFMYGYSDVIAVTFSGTTFTFSQVGHAPAVQKAIMQQLASRQPGTAPHLQVASEAAE